MKKNQIKRKLILFAVRSMRLLISHYDALVLKLEFCRNVYGDEVNKLNCRSIYKDEHGNEYKCLEMQHFFMNSQ